MDRWTTFDCYGTLIDWNTGIADALARIWPGEDRASMLATYHEVEPIIEAEGSLPYAEVLARCVERIAYARGLPLEAVAPASLPASLPSWPPFAEVQDSLIRVRDDGWRIAVLSNTDPAMLDSSLEAIGVDVDLTITVADTGSYKPAYGHWQVFFERTDVERSRHVHIAASLYYDIAPCAAQGLNTVWINRLGESSALPRARELTDLTALSATLAEIVPEKT